MHKKNEYANVPLSILNINIDNTCNQLDITLMVGQERRIFHVPLPKDKKTIGIPITSQLERTVNSGHVRRIQKFVDTVNSFYEGDIVEFPVDLDKVS